MPDGLVAATRGRGCCHGTHPPLKCALVAANIIPDLLCTASSPDIVTKPGLWVLRLVQG